jgi:hypothetical protein
MLSPEQKHRAKMPNHDQIVLGAKPVIETHRAPVTVRGLVSSGANPIPEHNGDREDQEAE